MWLGPVVFIIVSVFLWKYVGAVFVPELVARRVFAILPALGDLELVILVNAAILYFGAYFAFSIFWAKLRRFFHNPFLAPLCLCLFNVIVVFPVFGRGVLWYRITPGLVSGSLSL